MTEPPRNSPDPDPWSTLRSLTPARIGIGRTGASLPSREVLGFRMAHAQARDAVHTPLDVDALRSALEGAGAAPLVVQSAAPARAAYLRRPDLGRRLSPESRALLQARGGGPVDLAIVVTDGLSSTAIHDGAAPFLQALGPLVGRSGWSLAPLVIAVQGRVALGDEIGALLRARAVVMLVGERPGLSAADSLGIYLTYDPHPGRNDAQRNCISNVRSGGLEFDRAALKLHWLLTQAFVRRLSGVALKDESDLWSLDATRRPAGLLDGKS